MVMFMNDDHMSWYDTSWSIYSYGKGYMHGRRAANVHLTIRTANCRGRYCCRVNSPEKAHSYLHGRRAVNHALCWFQTNLPLCRVIIACCFRVAALSGNAALALSPSGIAPKLNRIQLSAICRDGRQDHISNHRGRHLLPKNWGLILKFTLPKFKR